MKMKIKPPEKEQSPEARSNIGVRNPFPLAEAILLQKGKIKEPIDWTALSAEQARKLLEKAFKIPYDHLFDPNPEYKSPLYGEPKVGSGVPGPCGAAVVGWETVSADYPPPPPASGTNGLDAQQGCALDCYFIAAITSLAWTSTSSLSCTRVDENRRRYRFRTDGSAVSSNRETTRPLAVNSMGTLVYAKSSGSNVWPSLYEKAYAKFILDTTSDEPPIDTLLEHNPRAALWEVCNYNTGSLNTADVADEFATIRTRGNTGGSNGKTARAMVAWTYHDSGHLPAGYSWDSLIVANHAYSILGVTQVTIGEISNNCIVLRNPFGLSDITAATAKTGVRECTPTWYPGGFYFINGNFAITAAEFPKYFEGFAWRNP